MAAGALPVAVSYQQGCATTSDPDCHAPGVDPVAAGPVASLARPGGNVAGLTFDVAPRTSTSVA